MTSVAVDDVESVPTTVAPRGPIRLHVLGLPHTITTDAFSHCAFTGKVKRFGPMMQSVGYEVYHYGVEGADSGCTRNIDVLSAEEWEILRVTGYKSLHPEKTLAECRSILSKSSTFVGDLGNISTSLYKVFNERLKPLLREHYRSTETDLVCLPFGVAHDEALKGWASIAVETGIGYNGSYSNYRVFESYAWLHHELGRANKQPQNYWFVAPNYFDVAKWPLSLTPRPDTVGFLGRINDCKGLHELVAVANVMPHVRFIICGQGDPMPFLKHGNILYKSPIHGDDRAEYLGSLSALIAPSKFTEPFCGVGVEAQLCGTPVITTHTGAQTETVEQGVTGLRCHTLQDYVLGVEMAIAGKFDRTYIRERAVRLYDMYNVAKQYDYIFKCINDVHNASGGWYAKTSHMGLTGV